MNHGRKIAEDSPRAQAAASTPQKWVMPLLGVTIWADSIRFPASVRVIGVAIDAGTGEWKEFNEKTPFVRLECEAEAP